MRRRGWCPVFAQSIRNENQSNVQKLKKISRLRCGIIKEIGSYRSGIQEIKRGQFF